MDVVLSVVLVAYIVMHTKVGRGKKKAAMTGAYEMSLDEQDTTVINQM